MLGYNDIYRDVKINILLKDVNGKEWNDFIILRVYKKSIKLTFSPWSVDFLIVSPDRNIIKANSYIDLPYRPDVSYKILASTLSVDQEAVYSIGVEKWDENTSEQMEIFTDTSIFEPNNSESSATTIKMGQQIISYLHKGDLDYYIVDMK